MEKIDASIADSRALSVVADAESATSLVTATSNAAGSGADPATMSEQGAASTANAAPTAHETESFVTATLTDQALPPDAQPLQAPAANTPGPEPRVVKASVDTVEILDECWDGTLGRRPPSMRDETTEG